jgi:hypothetical protein
MGVGTGAGRVDVGRFRNVGLVVRGQRLAGCGKSGFARRSCPQRLKAAIDFAALAARVELVPFPKPRRIGVFPQPVRGQIAEVKPRRSTMAQFENFHCGFGKTRWLRHGEVGAERVSFPAERSPAAGSRIDFVAVTARVELVPFPKPLRVGLFPQAVKPCPFKSESKEP